MVSFFSARRLVSAALMLSLCLVLPFLTGQIPGVGNMLCPMHLPVLLCGFLCGPLWALAVGAIAPVLRYALFSMPPLFPTGLAMCFELAAYGFSSGLMYRRLPRRVWSVYVSLIVSMLFGRLIWGAVRALISGAGGAAFTWQLFFAGAFTQALPGIALQLVLIPTLVLSLRRAGLEVHP